jgi:phosphate/sulfate permease
MAKIAKKSPKIVIAKKISKLTYVRLCLSGAIAGAALFSVVAPLVGIDVSHMLDVVGGVVGASTVAIGFKLAHLV